MAKNMNKNIPKNIDSNTDKKIDKNINNNIDTTEQKIPSSRMSEKLVKPLLSFLGLLLIAGSIGVAFYFYHQYQTTQSLLKNPNQVSLVEVQNLVNKVSKLIELPSETPQIATVIDQKKLATQPFFMHAVNGDKVLIFAKAREAILYRPSSNKLIEVSPLNIPSPSVQEQGHVAGTSTTVSKVPTPSVTKTPTPTVTTVTETPTP